MIKKIFKSYIIGLVVAFIFIGSVYLFLQSYHRYLTFEDKREVLTVRLKLLEDKKKEIEQKRRILAMVNDFVEKADTGGFKKADWTAYEVNINQSVFYRELGQILDQCTHTASYYFKPITLSVKTGRADAAVKSDKQAPLKTQPPEARHGDVQLELKGAFLSRHRK
jgi:hypothetical protein